MTTHDLNPRCAAPSGAAPAHPLRSAAARLGRGLENDTPDATAVARPEGRKASAGAAWRGEAVTTALREAGHPCGLSLATH